MFVRVVLMSVVAGSAAVLLQAPPSTAGLCTVEAGCVGAFGRLPFYAKPLPSLGDKTLSQVLVEHNSKIESGLLGDSNPTPCVSPAD